MFGRSITEKELEAIVSEALERALNKSSAEIKEALRLGEDIAALRKKLTDLEVSKSKKEEEFAKREREVEHMVGLERKRAEFEKESAKREATLSVREENLKAERKRFEDAMKFQNDRFTTEVGYLKDMIGRVLEAIPNVGTGEPKKRGR